MVPQIWWSSFFPTKTKHRINPPKLDKFFIPWLTGWIPIWLVVLTILKNMSSSMGRIIPYIMEKKNLWNHQPDYIIMTIVSHDKEPTGPTFCGLLWLISTNKHHFDWYKQNFSWFDRFDQLDSPNFLGRNHQSGPNKNSEQQKRSASWRRRLPGGPNNSMSWPGALIAKHKVGFQVCASVSPNYVDMYK